MKRRKRHAVEMLYKKVLAELGADCEPAYLDVVNTPRRVADTLVNELLVGYHQTEADIVRQLRMFPARGLCELVVEVNIPFTSLCAHHMLPFSGRAAVGYLPNRNLLGLSKLARILDFYAKRLQIQERLGGQVADFLMAKVKARASFVLLRAEHLCMSCRGVKKPGVQTVTSSIRPIPPDQTLLAEFYALVEHGMKAI